jgi:hypothetical protein
VTRPRPAHPGRAVAARPRTLPLLLLVVSAAFVGACIGGDVDDRATGTAAALTSSEPSSSTGPSAPSLQPSPSSSPSGIASPTQPASASPSAPPGSLDPEVAVEGCAGTDDNRAFFAEAAGDLDWPVYCPALPAGWYVDEGTYRTAGTGWLQITYRGPAGATFSLHEGAFCDDGDGCVAAGSDSGDAPFGDQTGTLVVLDDGGYALVVDRGQQPSWLAVGTGLDEAPFRDVAAGLIRLD